MGYIPCRRLLLLVLPLILCGMGDGVPAIPITTFPQYLQAKFQMQITCTYDATVYTYFQWVHPSVGAISATYGRFTIITNVQASGNQMYYRLQIRDPMPSDAGTYYCIFKTISASITYSTSIALVWKDYPQYQTPSGLVYRQFVQQSVLLECNVTNYLLFQWQYTNNTPVIGPSSDNRIQVRGTSLYFSSLQLSDAGTYHCVTTNEITPPFGTIQATIVVYETPSVQIDTPSRVVNSSGHANFTCSARGTPQPIIAWTRENSNDILVLSSARVTVTTGYSNPYVVSTINFLTVTGNDTGVYRCTASNSNGSVYINVNLLLYGTPTAPTNVNVVTYNGSVLNVTWGPPASNGNLDIISYTVYWQAGRSVKSVTLRGFPPPTQYLIGGLDYLTNYSISVVANNARGKGYSSSPFMASTAATVPSTPVNITIESVGPTSAVIAWTVPDDGGSPIVLIRLIYKDQSARQITANVSGSVAEYQLTGLAFNSPQTVSLSALNHMGEGPTALVSFSTTDVSEAPPYVTSWAEGDKAVVCWPSTLLGQPYLLYKVKVSTGSALDDNMVDLKPSDAVLSNGTTCVQITSLKYDRCYNFTVLIQNEHGFSLPAYSIDQSCTYRNLPPSSVSNVSQSKSQVVTVASSAVGGIIGLLLIMVVGVMVAVAMVTKTRATQTGDHCLDSVNSSNADTSKNSSTSLGYKSEGNTPNSTTALLKETPFTFPTQQSTILLEYPQHMSVSSVGHFNQDVGQRGLMRAVMTQNVEEGGDDDDDDDDDGLTENPAFMQQGLEDKDREMYPPPPPPYHGESCSPIPMFTVPDSDDCTAEDGTMFVENNAYELTEFQPIPEPDDCEPRFAITGKERGAVREMVQLNFHSK